MKFFHSGKKMSVKRALVGCKRVIDYATKVKNLREAEFCWRLYRVTCAKPQSVESPATCLGKENALLSLLQSSFNPYSASASASSPSNAAVLMCGS